jgi:hypothetical protein
MKELLELVSSGTVQMVDQEHDLGMLSIYSIPFGHLHTYHLHI